MRNGERAAHASIPETMSPARSEAALGEAGPAISTDVTTARPSSWLNTKPNDPSGPRRSGTRAGVRRIGESGALRHLAPAPLRQKCCSFATATSDETPANTPKARMHPAGRGIVQPTHSVDGGVEDHRKGRAHRKKSFTGLHRSRCEQPLSATRNFCVPTLDLACRKKCPLSANATSPAAFRSCAIRVLLPHTATNISRPKDRVHINNFCRAMVLGRRVIYRNSCKPWNRIWAGMPYLDNFFDGVERHGSSLILEKRNESLRAHVWVFSPGLENLLMITFQRTHIGRCCVSENPPYVINRLERGRPANEAFTGSCKMGCRRPILACNACRSTLHGTDKRWS